METKPLTGCGLHLALHIDPEPASEKGRRLMPLITETVYTAACDNCGNTWDDHYDFAVASPDDITRHGWRLGSDGTVTCADCAYLQHHDEPHRW